MKIALGADHGGYELKNEIKEWLDAAGQEVLDLGAHAYDRTDDYPDFAFAVADAVRAGQADRGIIICGSGVGASVAANKVPGIRAAICHDTYSARQGVEHDDMNVLVMGGRVIGELVALELVRAFLDARYTGEDRHQRRLKKVLAIEERYSSK